MIAIFFVLGLIVGSFLNVVICRLDLAESIVHGRSHCPKCKAKIRWYDNVPLFSFIMLKARCRDCATPISWQYPFIELTTGIIFALTGAYLFDLASSQAIIESLAYLAVFSLMIVVAGYDIKFLEIPMIMIWLSIALLLILDLFLDWKSFGALETDTFWGFRTSSGLLAGAISAAFFYALVFVSKEKWMGMGDVYVGFLLGLLTGFPGFFLGLLISFTTGSIFGIILVLMKKGTLKTQVPFAPFLVLGSIVTFFLLRQIDIAAYFGGLMWYF